MPLLAYLETILARRASLQVIVRIVMLCSNEETFGPFAPISRFDDEEDVIAAANRTECGLVSFFVHS